jgi:hypothetical protein
VGSSFVVLWEAEGNELCSLEEKELLERYEGRSSVVGEEKELYGR